MCVFVSVHVTVYDCYVEMCCMNLDTHSHTHLEKDISGREGQRGDGQ